MNDGIPEDVSRDILWRLPVGAWIARFLCVCKSWRHLLSDPSFITRKLSSSADGHQIMIIKRFTKEHPKSPVYTLHSPDTLEPLSPSPVPLPFDPEKLSDTHGDYRYLQVVGYCDGLLCIFDLYVRDLILWNPATSETKVLPPSPFYPPHPDYNIRSVGLGFDSETNDYKVVKLLSHIDRSRGGLVFYLEVYSLRNDSWRKFDRDFPMAIHFEFLRIPQFHKGKLYWWSLCHKCLRFDPIDENLRFDSFDMSSEVFQHVYLPCPPAENLDFVSKCFLNEESMLAVLPIYDAPNSYNTTRKPTSWEIWVLMKYWVPESWIKLLVIPNPPEMKIGTDYYHFSRNLKYFFVKEANYDGGYRFLDDERFFVYYPETGRFSELENQRKKTWRQIVTYVPSQVSLHDY